VPRLVSGPVEVPVGPFSGVAAAAGRLIVSGGTSELTVLSYDAQGVLGGAVERLDLGRGQPDVLLGPDGRLAVVSTHFSLLADTFGITTLDVESPPLRSQPRATLEIDGAGFAPGGARPASFPLETALAGSTLFVASAAGLAVVDLADPSRPRLLATLLCDVTPVNVDVRGSLVALVGSAPAPALVLVDVRRPEAPVVVTRSNLPAGAQPTGVALAGGHVVVAARGAGVLVLPLPEVAGG
jgi:hypothetical protein